MRHAEHFDHGALDTTGVLLTNVGTPAAPTASAVRGYLSSFLSDPRVIENQGIGWKLLLHGVILRTRPSKSASAYKEIWTREGSPLLVISQKQAQGVAERLASRLGNPIRVEVGMGYGSPSIDQGLSRLWEAGCVRVLVLPMYPQYAAATVGSTFDAVSASLNQTRWVRPLRFVSGYHDHPGYISALASSIRDFWSQQGKGSRLLLSFHGLPKDTLAKGDPYFCHCMKTARLLWDALGQPAEQQHLGFQSRFGRQEWLKPYTSDVLKEWGRSRCDLVDVVCPGFSADCLETLEEIGDEYNGYFQAAGGGTLRYIPALNDRADHLDFLADLVAQHLGDWCTPKVEWQNSMQLEASQQRKARAEAEKARGINI